MIDTHAHLYLCEESLDTLVKNAKEAGLTHIINVATNLENAKATRQSAEWFPDFIKATVGYYPSEAIKKPSLDVLEKELNAFPYRAIGEIGMDFYHDYGPEEIQATYFIEQLKLAEKYDLPVVIHNRHADEQMKPILKSFAHVKKVIHCYSSNFEFAQEVDSENTYFSFTGMITFATKGKVIHTLRQLDLSKIMIETDSPYITPAAHKGSRNQPAFVGEIAKRIAEVKEIPVQEVIQTTTETAKKFFNIP